MNYWITDIVFSMLGYVYLLFRYRNFDEMKNVRDTEYEGSYSLAGRDFFLSLMLITIMLCIVIFFIILIVITIRDL